MNPALISTLRAHALQLEREGRALIAHSQELVGLANRMSDSNQASAAEAEANR